MLQRSERKNRTGDNFCRLRLGNIVLDAPFFQAPLSGYSDYAMRRLAIECGAPLTFAGVMLAKSAAHPKILKKPLFRPRDDEHPIGAQILGSSPELMAKAAKALCRAGYDLVDLNFACPAPKVLRRGRGGYLLKEPDKAIEIFRRVKEAVNCPVTIKLRTSFKTNDGTQDNFWKIAEQTAADGADALIVHGRSVVQKFREAADWQILAELKKKLSNTTIIGSGDLFDARKTIENLKTSGIDGVLIARGAIGNPWIFRELREILDGNPNPEAVGIGEQRRVILRHFELVCQLYDTGKAVRYLRKFLVNYCKRHPQRKKAQHDLIAAKNKKQLFDAIDRWYSLHL